MQVLKNVSPDDVTLCIATSNLAAARGSANVVDSLKKFDKLQARKDAGQTSGGKKKLGRKTPQDEAPLGKKVRYSKSGEVFKLLQEEQEQQAAAKAAKAAKA